MAVAPKSISKYEIRSILGQGGMGLVYKAYDADVRREVALKTILGTPDRNTLQMFQKEYEVLKNLTHPNIIEIFDIGEYEEENQRRPFFVMPLLQGNPLEKLIRTAAHRLTVERVVEIMSQTCRGLHAAHEQGLIHRDIKPRNIFVMSDDSVKIIDFGIAHMVDGRTTRGQKGTLLYMSPEQLEVKTLTPASDIFSLAVVCYEALTQRRPFERSTESQVFEAILHQMPPPISGLNPGVNQTLSRVIHKAMAKQPWHRFSTAREFSDTLNKALRNEPIEIFDSVRIQPRIQRAAKAFQDGDYEFAGEILDELEAEGHLDSTISELRRQVNQAVRQKKIHQLLESARTRFEEGEDPLALQKVDEVLQLDHDNLAALTLKAKIESRRSERQIEGWFRLVQQHIDNHSYSHARQALQNVLQIRPMDKRAAHLLSEVERMAQEYTRTQQEKQRLYQAALDAWQNGEVSSALTKMGGVLDLDRRAPDTSHPEHTNLYQGFYNKVRTEHDSMNQAYAEARKYLADRNYARALTLCEEYLAKHPGHALLQALKFDVEVQQRQQLSAHIAEIDRRIEAEADLDKCISILQEALTLYPGETHFERSLRTVKDKNDLVNAILAKARLYEERGQFGEALGQWEILHTIYGQYPGLNYEIERVTKRRELQSQSEDKARWIEQIDAALHTGERAQAFDLLAKAQVDFPNDGELLELGKLVQKSVERATEAQLLLERGEELCAQDRLQGGLEYLRKARALDERNPAIRSALLQMIVQQARNVLDKDWHSSEILAQEALSLDPNNALAKSVQTLVMDRKKDESVGTCLTQVRRLQAAGDVKEAMVLVERALATYLLEPRLLQARDTLQQELPLSFRQQIHLRDLERTRRIEQDASVADGVERVRSFWEDAQFLASQYPQDEEIQACAKNVGRRLQTIASMPSSGSDAENNHSWERQAGGAAELPPEVTVGGDESPLAARWKEIRGTATRMLQEQQRWIGVAAAVIVILIVGVWAVMTRHRPVAIPSAPFNDLGSHIDEVSLTDVSALRQVPGVSDEMLVEAVKANRQTELHAVKSAPVSVAPAVDDNVEEIRKLQQSAREAYTNRQYAEPTDASAIYYSKQILASDPNNAWAQKTIAGSIQGVKYLIAGAIEKKDFAGARQQLTALALLLPEEKDLKSIQANIDYAEKEAVPHPKLAPPPILFSADVSHLHGRKAYSEGILSVIGRQLGYKGKPLSGGGPDSFMTSCSEIDVMTEHKRVFSHHKRYEVHTVSNKAFSFEPKSESAFNFKKLHSVCARSEGKGRQ